MGWALLCATPLLAIDTLVVGTGDLDWKAIEDEAQYVTVVPESIWTWDAEPNANLMPGMAARGGSMRVWVRPTVPFENALKLRPGMDAWVDGDPTTAWGPDEDDVMGRGAAMYIDLGCTFRVNQIRMHPRLDRHHRMSFLGTFQVATHDGVFEGPFEVDLPHDLHYRPLLTFSSSYPNREPIVERRFPTRDVRFMTMFSQEVESWEIAEIEVRGDGSMPVGEFVSQPLYVRGGYPIWGRVTTDAGELDQQSISVYTRTGSDPEPLHYFLKFQDQLERVSHQDYAAAAERSSNAEQGPVRPNPEWSLWQPVTDGQVQSPGPRRYLQFRVLLHEPGTRIERLHFEYIKRPLAEDLAAEIAPVEVEPGEETEFTLSMEVHINAERGDAGFRYLEVLTPATVHGVDAVLIDDEPAIHTALLRPSEGFSIDTWERQLLPGSFVQLVFRASVFRDGTPFRVRVMDYFPRGEELEFVYQTAREEDVEPLSVGGSLLVRLRSGEVPLLQDVEVRTGLITPNGDGVNDVFEVSFALTKLTEPAALGLELLDLTGRRIRRIPAGEAALGRHRRTWDGCDEAGQLVPPGHYLYRLQVMADTKTVTRHGHVQVAY